MKKRLEGLIAAYGSIALWIYLTLFVIVFAGFAAAISLGMKVDSAMGSATTLGAAYLATKLSQPLRLLGTVLLTPVVHRALKRRQ